MDSSHDYPAYHIKDGLEDGELTYGNCRRGNSYRPDIFMSQSAQGDNHLKHNQFHFLPHTRTNWNRGSEIQEQDVQPIPGHYCGLSYYGEEIDKEYLPDTSFLHMHAHEQPNQTDKYNMSPSEQWNANHYGKKSFQNSPYLQQQFVYNVRNEGISPPLNQQAAHIVNPTHQQPFIRNRNPQFVRSIHNDFVQLDAGNKAPCFMIDANANQVNQDILNIPSCQKEINSNYFKNAASCFQEKQVRQNAQQNAFQGWSHGSNQMTTQRKVTFHNEDNNETKLRKRQNRFRESLDSGKVRGSSDELSLEEIIKNKNVRRKLEMQPGKRNQQMGNTSSQKSMWLSGDGKSYSVERTVSFEQQNRYSPYQVKRLNATNGHATHPTESFDVKDHCQTHYNGKRCDRNRQNKGFPDRQNNIPRDFNIASRRCRPVVIDGSSVAFNYGENLHFACEGIRVCVEFFQKMGCKDIIVVVPEDRDKPGACKDRHILQRLMENEMLLTNINGAYGGGDNAKDAFFIFEVARSKRAIIISNNEHITTIVRRTPGLRSSVWKSVLNFKFSPGASKEILFPDINSSGMFGITWDDVIYI